MHRNLFLCQVYAFLTVLLWSSAYVFTKVALEQYSFSSLAFLRCAVATVFLGAFLIAKRKSFPGVASLPRFFASGAVGFALYILVFNKGSILLNPTTSCIVISTSPILTAWLARFFFGEKLGVLGWTAISLSFCGILIMSLWDGEFSVSQGIVWMLGAALLISLYNILQRSLAKQFEPLLITAYSFFAGTVLLAPFSVAAFEQISSAPAPQVWLVVFLGAFPSAIAYLLWAKALSLAPHTSTVANYMFLTPFLALILEYGVTGALPGVGTFVGGGFILASLVIFFMGEPKAVKGFMGPKLR